MPSSPTQSNPPGFELVQINKVAAKARFAHFDEAIKEGRVTIADLLEFHQWLGREDYAYQKRAWKDSFTSGAKVVGFDSEVRTLLSPSMPAGGIDLADIRREIAAGRLQKPKISSLNPAEALFGPE
jgi:hypothetical protein